MKKVVNFLLAATLLCWGLNAFAQAPQKFNYQAVVRDGNGNVIANQIVGIRISIHEGSAAGTLIYQETQTSTTNQFGLITLQIGTGTKTGAAFTSVDWSKKAKYIQMEIDAEGGTNYTDIGASELLSVPYALYAENAGGSVSSKDSVPAGTFGQTLRYDTVGVDRWVANSLLYNNGTRLGIGTTSPLCRVHVADGALIVTGTIGATPISGAGTRFMWIPPKKALRAGTVSGNQWDDANLGLSSTSVGEDNIASGTYAVALGRQDSATGSNSTAVGFRNLASNTGAVAFGGNNKATGYYSFTAGNMNKPSGQYSVTLGYSNMASADYAVAMGKTTVASGQYGLALGYLTLASGNYSFAVGKSTIASGVYSMASGEGSVASKNNCISFGYYNAANGMYSVAMGIYAYARSYASTVFGKHNIIAGDSAAWIATDPIFVIGNGTSSTARSNALTVLKNGNMGILDDTPASPLTVGSGDLFQVNSGGDMVKIKNMTYSWPTSYTAGTFLKTDASGNLTWEPAVGAIGPTGPTGVTGVTGVTGLTGPTGPLVSGTSGQTLRYNSGWVANSLLYNNGSRIGIGTTSPSASSTLHVASQRKWAGLFTSDSLADSTKVICAKYIGALGNKHVRAVYGKSVANDNYGYGGEFEGGYIGVRAIGKPVSGTASANYYGTYSSVNDISGKKTIVYGTKSTAYTSGQGFGIYGYASGDSSSYGGFFKTDGGFAGLYGSSQNGTGMSLSNLSLYLTESANMGIYAYTDGNATVDRAFGTFSQSYSNSLKTSTGVYGEGQGSLYSNLGVWGVGIGTDASDYNVGIYGETTDTSVSGYAGYFVGDVHVQGTLSKSAGTFKIDHPLDPANKYLIHSFVESPDMKNIYDGIVTTDANGKAIVQMPSYFEAENIDFKYQLTVIGQFAQAIVAVEIANNQFEINTDKPNVKVSWQVTGVRNDAYAQKYRIVPEVAKTRSEKGKYLNPELFGKTTEYRIGPVPAKQGNYSNENLIRIKKNHENLIKVDPNIAGSK